MPVTPSMSLTYVCGFQGAAKFYITFFFAPALLHVADAIKVRLTAKCIIMRNTSSQAIPCISI